VSLGSRLKAIQQFIENWNKVIIVAAVSVVIGIGLAASYASVIDYTSSLNFCAHTCHEMEATVYQEYTHSKHFKNEYGVVVACPQCHVPQNHWALTFGHKLFAAFEIKDHFVERLYEVKNFTPKRLELAKQVWKGFAETNARECKACHQYKNMLLDEQRSSIRAQHTDAMKTDENCLDCHKGVVHEKPVDPNDKSAAKDFSF
jgi:cytochrome c-type protein NapC